MACPYCGNTDLRVTTETTTTGKDFSGSKGLCGYIFFGPIGVLCGACGKGKKTQTQTYWLCPRCGSKFKA